MALPLIGITTYGRNAEGSFHLPAAYVDMVRVSGAIPVLLPPGERSIGEIVGLIDSLILAGGRDLDPSLYGGSNHPALERINPERDSFELNLAKTIMGMETPVLGICRGMQILNVACGGTLVEHLTDRFGTSVSHRGANREPVQHVVRVSDKSRLGNLSGKKEFPVMSLHHQALGGIAGSWIVSARSSDTVVEAIEKPDHPWMLAVLWHPELAFEHEEQRSLMKSFVEAAGKYKLTKQGTSHASER